MRGLVPQVEAAVSSAGYVIPTVLRLTIGRKDFVPGAFPPPKWMLYPVQVHVRVRGSCVGAK